MEQTVKYGSLPTVFGISSDFAFGGTRTSFSRAGSNPWPLLKNSSGAKPACT